MKFSQIIMVIAIIIVVIALSGCITDNLNSGNKYEYNGITFNYPDDWQEANSIANGSMGAIAYKNNSQISIVVQKVPKELGTTLNQSYQNNNNQISKMSGYINIQENTTTINNKNVQLHRYILNDQIGNQKEHIAAWFKESDNNLYVILYSAPVENYEQEKNTYDTVVSTFGLENKSSNSLFGIDLSNII